jgi:hypothetical protein
MDYDGVCRGLRCTQSLVTPPQEVGQDQHPFSLGIIASPLLFCSLLLSLFLSILSPSHIRIINVLFVPVVIFKGSEAKVDDGQLFPHGNKEDEDLQPKVQGGGGSNQTMMKVCAFFLKILSCLT